MPAAPGAGWGRSAGRQRLWLGLGLGLGLGLQLGPCTCDSAALLLRCPMAPSRLQLGLRAAYSGFSSVAGFSIFFVWTVVYRQPGTAAMGGLAGMGGARGDRGGLRAASGVALPRGLERCLLQRDQRQRRPGFLGSARASGTWCLLNVAGPRVPTARLCGSHSPAAPGLSRPRTL